MVEVGIPSTTPFLSYEIKNEDFSTINNPMKEEIQSRLRMVAPDFPTRIPLCIRGRIHRLGKKDNLSFSFNFGFKYGKFEKLIKDLNDDYHKLPLRKIDPEPGTFGVVYLEDEDLYIRVKVLKVEKEGSKVSKFSSLAVDYGYEVEAKKEIFHLFDKFRFDDYRYAFCVPCRLPDWPGQKVYPVLEEIREGSDVDVFILSAFEPCLAIFNPIGKTATDSIKEYIIYQDLDDEASLALRMFMTQPLLERPLFVKTVKPSTFSAYNWKLVTVVDSSEPEAFLVRDIFMSVRVIFIQNRLNKLLKDKEFLESLILKPESVAVGLPVIVYDEKTEQYYRGKITSFVPEAGWRVRCVDFPCRELVCNKSPMKEDGVVENLYMMPEVLLSVPTQYYTVSLVDVPAHLRNDLGRFLYSDLVNRVLPPGSVSRVLPAPGTMKVKIHDEEAREIFEDLPRRIFSTEDNYVEGPDAYFREYFNILRKGDFDEDSDFSVASLP